MISAPTPRMGRCGYRRESLILERSLYAEADLIDGFAAGHVKGLEVRVAESQVGDDLAREQLVLQLAVGRVNTQPTTRDVKVPVHVGPKSARDTFHIFDHVP